MANDSVRVHDLAHLDVEEFQSSELAKLRLVFAGLAAVVLILGAAFVGAQYSRYGCAALADEASQVRQALNRGRPDLARDLADLTLETAGNPCETSLNGLVGLRYDAALDSLVPSYGSGAILDPSVQRQAVTLWQEAESKADAFALPKSLRRPPAALSRDAARFGLWALAQETFVKAHEVGAIGITDLNSIYGYTEILRHWGEETLASSDVAQRQGALSKLRTSAEIASLLNLRSNAVQVLSQQLGPDASTWPPADEDDPILKAARLRSIAQPPSPVKQEPKISPPATGGAGLSQTKGSER